MTLKHSQSIQDDSVPARIMHTPRASCRAAAVTWEGQSGGERGVTRGRAAGKGVWRGMLRRAGINPRKLDGQIQSSCTNRPAHTKPNPKNQNGRHRGCPTGQLFPILCGRPRVRLWGKFCSWNVEWVAGGLYSPTTGGTVEFLLNQYMTVESYFWLMYTCPVFGICRPIEAPNLPAAISALIFKQFNFNLRGIYAHTILHIYVYWFNSRNTVRPVPLLCTYIKKKLHFNDTGCREYPFGRGGRGALSENAVSIRMERAS